MIKRIYKIFNDLTPRADFLKHFWWGFVGLLFCLPVYGVVKWYFFESKLIILIPILIGAGIKEYADSKGNGKAEFLDFVFTLIPAILTILTLYLL